MHREGRAVADDGQRDPTPSERLRARGWDVVDPAALDAEPTVMELSSIEQMRALNDPLRMRLMGAISRRPDSAKELAQRFDVPTTRLYHHLDLLEEHGFIEVVATRRSGARTERCYGMRPRSSVRPGPALTGAEDRRELAAALAAVIELTGTSLAEAVIAGRADLADDDAPIVVSSGTMRLTPEQQRRFANELTDLQQRMIDESNRTAGARDRGEDIDDEAVQLLLVMAPDVLAPD
jgi:DNA-binding transcriptional ArsR family regulator